MASSPKGRWGVGEHLIIDATRLPSADSGPAGARIERGESAHRQALAEIARRYATGHGPVSALDLARWTGLNAADSVRALEDEVEETTSARFAEDTLGARHRLMRIRVQRGPRGGWVEEARRQRRADPDVLYLRADVVDIAAENSRWIARTLFLASFDELHVGYKDRSCLTDEAGERLICPPKTACSARSLSTGGGSSQCAPHPGASCTCRSGPPRPCAAGSSARWPEYSHD